MATAGIGQLSGTSKKKKKTTKTAPKNAAPKKRRRKALGAIAAAPKKRRRRRSSGFGSINQNNFMGWLMRGFKVAGGSAAAAFLFTAVFKNKTDPSKDEKIKQLRGPAAILAGAIIGIAVKNEHVRDVMMGFIAQGFMRTLADLVLKDKKAAIGLGVAEDVGAYELGEATPFYGAEDVSGAEDVGEVPMFGAEDVGEVPMFGAEDVSGAEDVGEVPMFGAEDVSGLGNWARNDWAVPQAQFVQQVPMAGAEALFGLSSAQIAQGANLF